jgi:hypothetical protein
MIKNWKWWITITVLSVLLVLSLVFVVIGIASHKEKTLLMVCWDREGKAIYKDDEIEERSRNKEEVCKREELVWPQKQIPIILRALDFSNPSEILPEADFRNKILGSVIRDINIELGFRAFQQNSDVFVPSYGHVYFGQPAKVGIWAEHKIPSGYVFHCKKGSFLEGYVHIRADVESSERLLYEVLRHELLHLIGLAHDDFTLSVMYPLTEDDTLEEVFSTAHITDVDRAKLRELYMNQE